MSFSVAPSVQYTERDATLFTKAAVTVAAGFSGLAPWGEANSPVRITGGEQNFVNKFFKPTNDTYQDFFVAVDYMNYANTIYYNRLIGAAAMNAVSKGQTAVLVENRNAFDTATFDTDLEFMGRYPGALGNSLAVAVADHNTFATWDFKDNFEYAPREGEFAVCVVDTTGLITGGNAGRGQINKFTVTGGFNYATIDGFDIAGPLVGDMADQYKAAFDAAGDFSVYASATVAGNEVRLERAAHGSSAAPTSVLVDQGVDTGITTAWSIHQAATGTQEVQKFVLSGTNTTAGNFVITRDDDSVLWTVALEAGDNTAAVLAKIKAVVEADAIVDTVTVDAVTGDGEFTVEFVIDQAQTTVMKAVTTGLDYTGVTVTVETAQVLGDKQIDSLAFSVTTYNGEHTITLDGESGVDVVINRGDSADAIMAKMATQLLADAKYGAAKVERGVVYATMAQFDANYAISTAADVALGVVTGITVEAAMYDKPFLGTVIENEAYELLKNEHDAKNSDGSTAYFADVLNDSSSWVYSAGDTLAAGWTTLEGGVDDHNVDRVSGFNAYKNAITYQISALVDSAATVDTQQAAIDVCIKRRDAVAFISPPMTAVVNRRGNEADLIEDWSLNQVLRDSSYFFQDDNWGYVWDKYNGKWRWIPCAGGTAGLRARTHAMFGPWKSFAFHNRGKYLGYKRTAWSADDDERLALYKAKVNSISTVPGGGIVLMGDKTGLSRPSAFDRCNVRDTFIMMEQNISAMAKYFLGENNDEFTRGLFLNTVRPYIRNLEDQAAILEGKVKCDETNNTGQVIAANQLKAGIWVKPQYSINWIWLDFAALRPDMSFDELEGATGLATAG